MLAWRRREDCIMATPTEHRLYTAIMVGLPADILAAASRALSASGCDTVVAPDGAAALRAARRQRPDFIIAYHELPDSGGLKVVQSIKRKFPLALGAVAGPAMAQADKRRVIDEGADAYLEVAGATGDQVTSAVSRFVARRQIGIIGSNEKTLRIIETIEGIAPTKVTVLISGESGTGKELIARAIHARSGRRAKPFIAVNCGALPQGVLESELFGHEKGSFTGAIAQRKGRFEIADGGTLLLDEVGEMPLGTQVKLLRVLEEEKFMRVGGSADVKVDVRVIASTNKNLWQLVETGDFRADLYYRLNVVAIDVPPLRDRKEDIPALFRAVVEEASRKNHVEFGGISDAAMAALAEYRWPGNVRELKNLVESLVVLKAGKPVDLGDLPDQMVSGGRNLPATVGRPRSEGERDLLMWRLSQMERLLVEMDRKIETLAASVGKGDLAGKQPVIVPGGVTAVDPQDAEGDLAVRAGASIKDVERKLIERTLREVGGNRKRTAALLGMGERTLYRRMKQYDLR
jgi:DNA-binding NtrC family response regulator